MDRLPQLSKRRQAERLERMHALYGVSDGAPKPPPTPDIEMEPKPSASRKPDGPIIDVEWEDITDDEQPRRKPRKLPPPLRSSTDFEL
jgi:hypothetical protein